MLLTRDQGKSSPPGAMMTPTQCCRELEEVARIILHHVQEKTTLAWLYVQ